MIMANMTYVEAIEVAISTLAQAPEQNDIVDESNATVIEKLEALKAQLEKRGTKKTPTKTQKENEVIMERILDTLTAIGEPTTVTDLLAYGVEGFELTNQKASALLRKLKEAGKVTKTIEGKKAMFSIA
jgi:DNA-binding transcriptional ArsR family regulator